MERRKLRTREHGQCEFDVTTDVGACVEAVCLLALSGHQATHWHENKEPDGSTSITFSWTEQPGWNRLPFAITTAKQLADFIFSWLESGNHYGKEPYSGDGDHVAGVRLVNHIAYDDKTVGGSGNSFYYVIVAKPEWVYYGK